MYFIAPDSVRVGTQWFPLKALYKSSLTVFAPFFSSRTPLFCFPKSHRISAYGIDTFSKRVHVFLRVLLSKTNTLKILKKHMMETKRPAFEYKSIENNTVPSFLQDKLEICNSKRCQRVHHGTELLFNHSHDMSCACGFPSSALSSAGSSKRHKLFCMFWRFASSSKGLVALICVPLLLSSFNEPVVFERQSDNEHGS